MNLKKLFYTFLSLFAIYATNAHEFSLCDSDNIINVISVDLNPDPPIVNENLEVLIKLNSTISITEASGVLDIKAFGIDITKVNFNPCEQKDVCPLNKNTVKTISITELIPKEAPAGIKINTETTLNSNNKKLVCIDLQTTLSKKTILLDDNEPNSNYCGNIMKYSIAGVTRTLKFKSNKGHFSIC